MCSVVAVREVSYTTFDRPWDERVLETTLGSGGNIDPPRSGASQPSISGKFGSIKIRSGRPAAATAISPITHLSATVDFRNPSYNIARQKRNAGS
jgi:hypothetical protein